MNVRDLLSEHLSMKCSLIAERSGDISRDTITAIHRAFTIANELGTTVALTSDLAERIELLDYTVDDDGDDRERLQFIMSTLGLTSIWAN